MCIVRTKTRICSDGRRETIEERDFCSAAVGDTLCRRVTRKDLGQERNDEVVPERGAASSSSQQRSGLGKKTSADRSRSERVSLHQTSSQRLERIVEYTPAIAMTRIEQQAPAAEASPSSYPPTLDGYTTRLYQPVRSRSPSQSPPGAAGLTRRVPLSSPPFTSMRRPAPLNIPDRSTNLPPSPILVSPGLSRLRSSQRSSRHDSGYVSPPLLPLSDDGEYTARESARSALRQQRSERDRSYLAQERLREQQAEYERQAEIERGRLSAREEMRAARVRFSPSPANSSDPESRERHRRDAYEKLTAASGGETQGQTPDRVSRLYTYSNLEATSPGGVTYRIHRTSLHRPNSSGTEAPRSSREMDRASDASERLQEGLGRMQGATNRMSLRSEEHRYSDSYHNDAHTRRRRRKSRDGDETRARGDQGFFD